MSGYSEAVLVDHPVSYWQLNESSGTAAVDRMGVRDGVYNLTGVTLGVPGPPIVNPSTAALFDGTTNAIVSLADVAAHNITGDISLEAWIKTTSVAQSYIFSGGFGYFLEVGMIGTVGMLDFNGWGGPIINDGIWHHVVASALIGTTALNLYLDGKLQMPERIINGDLGGSYSGVRAIGHYSGGPFVGAWDGSLAEVALYNTALSAERVRAHYQAGITPHDDISDVARTTVKSAGAWTSGWGR